MKDKILRDIKYWVVNYIEAKNKFYDYKFAVCPFAKQARINGRLTYDVFVKGNMKTFISENVDRLIKHPKHEVMIMVFPPRKKWTIGLKRFFEKINRKAVPQGYYVQHGTAVGTSSRYPGFLNGGRYFVVLINKLEPVLAGHEVLKKTDYYKNWKKSHYDDVVVRRQKLYEKYKDGDVKKCPFHRFFK